MLYALLCLQAFHTASRLLAKSGALGTAPAVSSAVWSFGMGIVRLLWELAPLKAGAGQAVASRPFGM